MFPDLADVEALQDRLGRALSDLDRTRAEANLADVSAFARGVAEQDWPDAPVGVPGEVVALVLAVARRVFENPDRYVSQTMGPHSATRASGTVSADVFTAAEIAVLRRARPRRGLWTLSTTRGDADYETGFVRDDIPGSDPIAWYASGDPGYDDAFHVGG